ncbi:MAG: methyltransferase domain-containing protein [Chlorobiaceae bacterium]|nr:methyltransferase domain-containing protein [Chlorobiaceae bacterium]
MERFDEIASRYRQTSLVQASAGAKLIELLDIPKEADILDMGCGTGNLTAELAGKTTGRVTGIDPSGEMVRVASEAFSDQRTSFMQMEAEGIAFREEFDIVYCNSAFQWFRNPARFLDNAKKALRPGGRIGMQAPARHDYCPAFIAAIETCCENPEIGKVFSGFRSPWFFLDTEDEYRKLFEQAGFTVLFCTIEESRSRRTPQQVFDVFCSGAKAGYLDPACYYQPWPEWFETAFHNGIRQAFESQADNDGLIDLMFHRIFIVAER